jgi:hypothetical protein
MIIRDRDLKYWVDFLKGLVYSWTQHTQFRKQKGVRDSPNIGCPRVHLIHYSVLEQMNNWITHFRQMPCFLQPSHLSTASNRSVFKFSYCICDLYGSGQLFKTLWASVATLQMGIIVMPLLHFIMCKLNLME